MSLVDRLSPSQSDDFTAAIQEAKQGKSSGWNALFDHMYGILMKYTLSHIDDQHAAEDIVQEVFVSASKSISGLRGTSRPVVESWFLSIAKFRIRDAFRKPQQMQELPEDIPSTDDPANMAADNLIASDIRTALAQLPEKQRDVLIRRFILDQSIEEVAQGMHRPKTAIKALQHRAMKALSRELEHIREDIQ
ncbi:MAG: RNA polymerase sigma factor [Candidatus Dormibacteria bacterium]